MNKSNFFVLSIISLSAFSCSAMEINQQITTLTANQQIINYIPILNRLAKGEPAANIVLDICTGATNGLEAARQGYQFVATHPVTTIMATGAQTGANILANNAYSAGVTLCTATQNLYQWAYTERSITDNKNDHRTSHEALFVFNNTMKSIAAQQKQQVHKKLMIENLKTIHHDVYLITVLINRTKDTTDNKSSGVRTTIIEYLIKRAQSEDNITEKEAEDFAIIMNEIVNFSKTNDGENNLAESVVEINEKELLSELQKAANPTGNNVFLEFIKIYMPNDSNIQALLEKKNQSPERKLQNITNKHNVQPELSTTEQLQQFISVLKQHNFELEQNNTELAETKRLNLINLEQCKQETFQLINTIKEHSATIRQLTLDKEALEKDKQDLNTTIARQQELLDREKGLNTLIEQENTSIKAIINRLYFLVKIGSGIGAIVLLIHYFKLHEQCMALLQ